MKARPIKLRLSNQFPLYARCKDSTLIVKFIEPRKGTVIEVGKGWTKGVLVSHWTPLFVSGDDKFKSNWEILPNYKETN